MIHRLTALPARTIDAIGAGVVVAILAIAFMGGVWPALQGRVRATERARALTEARAAAQRAADEVTAAEKLRAQLVAERKDELVLQSPAMLNARLAQLTALSGASRVAVHQLNPGSQVMDASRPFGIVPIKLQGAGEFADCVELLDRLHSEYRDIGATAIKLTVARPASDEHAARLDMTLDLAWYTVRGDSAGAK